MLIKIENENFIAEISTLGAEINCLKSKKDGTDFIWNGDPSVWKNHAPILFPFVAKPLGDKYLIDGIECEYPKNHGFVRDLETEVIYQEKSKVIFQLTDSDKTLYRYPYHFCLQSEYELVENGLNWKLSVKNTDTRSFKFSIGTHAAFCCPRNTDPEGTLNSDYVVEFEGHKPLNRVVTTPENLLLENEEGKCPYTKPYNESEKGFIPLTADGFGNGHLFAEYSSEWVGLRNKNDNSLVSIESKGFPYCMIWQNTAGKPSFICIEPWHGIPDHLKTDHIWDHKLGLVSVDAGKTFECTQNIRIQK